MSKRIIAMAVAVALIVVMIPSVAFAASYISVTGTIKDTGPNYIQVHAGGMDVSFFIIERTVMNTQYLGAGDKVRVLFDPTQPDVAVQVTLIETASRPPVSHTHYSVSGVVTDATMNVITVLTTSGTYRSFAKDEAQISGASDGILLGDTVKIVYAADNPQVALQIKMIKHGDNHASPAPQTTALYSVTGLVTDAGMSTITILANKKYRTFNKEDAQMIGFNDGLALGDTVKITYHKEDPQMAISVKMIVEGGNH